MRLHYLPTLALATSLGVATVAIAQVAEKKVITSADQLPRRQYALAKLPSELIAAPASDLRATVDALDRDLASDLATLDIRDLATRTDMIGARA